MLNGKGCLPQNNQYLRSAVFYRYQLKSSLKVSLLHYTPCPNQNKHIRRKKFMVFLFFKKRKNLSKLGKKA